MNYKKSYVNRLKRIFFIALRLIGFSWHIYYTYAYRTTLMMPRMTSLTLAAVDNANGSNYERDNGLAIGH